MPRRPSRPAMAELRRVAVVSGGTRGIGAAITERVASDGAHVVATFATDKESAFDLQSRLGDRGLSVSVHQVDVRAPEDCQRLVAEVLDERGRVDYLVNNAGIDHHARLQETPIEVWDDVISTDLSGAFYLTRLAVDPMVAQGFGRIVSISSIAAVKGSS